MKIVLAFLASASIGFALTACGGGGSAPAIAPGAPTAVSAAAGNAEATVTFAAPANNGGSAITGYTVTTNPVGGTDTNAGSTALTHVVTGLFNGYSYSFSVTATSAAGTSTASNNSLSVIPTTKPLNGDGTWSYGPNPTSSSGFHTATLLPNGKILFVDAATTATLLYNPATGQWEAGGALSTPRLNHTATLLTNGKVLVAGGFVGGFVDVFVDGYQSLATCELYDPSTNSWSTVGSLAYGRGGHTATLLFNGKVLVAGGAGGIPSSTLSSLSALVQAEIFDPSTNSWSSAGSLIWGREFHTMSTMGNGNVIVSGGISVTGQTLSETEIYDVASNSWGFGPSMNFAHENHRATTLPNGDVWVVGGAYGSNEVYDPIQNSWTLAGQMSTIDAYGTSILLPNGKVLSAGGFGLAPANNFPNTSPAMLYTYEGNGVTATSNMLSVLGISASTLMADGAVFVWGPAYLNTVQIYSTAP